MPPGLFHGDLKSDLIQMKWIVWLGMLLPSYSGFMGRDDAQLSLSISMQ
jgi:hypothetical protein